MNYLDLNIIKTSDNKLLTNWYKKPSWSGRYLNYDSHHPFSPKIGLIKGFVDRCIKLSDIQFRKENLDNIKVTLLMNNYPLPFVKSVIKERIHEIYNSTNINRKKQKSLEEYKKSVFKNYFAIYSRSFRKVKEFST